MQTYVRRLGLSVCQAFIEARTAEVVEEGRSRGLVTQRRPEVKFYTVFGPVSVESPYMWCAVDQFGWSSLREEFGVVDPNRSRRLDRALVDFGSGRSFAKAALGFEEHYGWELGRTTMLALRLLKANGWWNRYWDADKDRLAAA